jgi:hypothetical protein
MVSIVTSDTGIGNPQQSKQLKKGQHTWMTVLGKIA